ncbi:hypothetical protein AAU01_10950 [Paenarthrobacter aurescens]|uniref:Uncharacterized protein n=1 Tax=Paenarthrobacter aurescens TaxID=43663 RepID=A0A4Y3N929_PAEAU|nr:hypothetical protein AAU01_10950 [Paenarthrobacter aurescens]
MCGKIWCEYAVKWHDLRSVDEKATPREPRPNGFKPHSEEVTVMGRSGCQHQARSGGLRFLCKGKMESKRWTW